MRILKKKVAMANLRRQQLQAAQSLSIFEIPTLSFPLKQDQNSLAELKQEVQTPKRGRRKCAFGNNIMKNYCRALVNFGISPMAEPYVKQEEGETTIISPETFRSILNSKKKKVNCIKTLRALLLNDGRDSKEMRAFKPVFQRVCIVFLKFFCANWIFNSKVADKMKHLKYRGKMLRRVQNPQYFTYLEDFSQKSHSDEN